MQTLTTAPPEGGLREAKKRRTRAALVRCARELVLAHGLDAVTVHQICAAAEVAPRTFFNYFDTKDAAVLGLSQLGLDPQFVGSFADGGPTGDAAEDVAQLVAQVLATTLPSASGVRETLALLHREPRLISVHVQWMDAHRESLAELIAARHGTEPGAPSAGTAAGTQALAVLTLCRTVLEAAEAAGTPDLDHGDVLALARTAVQNLSALLR